MCESNNIFLANIFPSALQNKIQVRVNNPQKEFNCEIKVYFCYFFSVFLFGKHGEATSQTNDFIYSLKLSWISENYEKIAEKKFFFRIFFREAIVKKFRKIIIFKRRSSQVCHISITKNLHTCCFSEDSVEDTINKTKATRSRLSVFTYRIFSSSAPESLSEVSLCFCLRSRLSARA